MSVCGCACTKVRMGGVCGRFNKAAEYDRYENAMRALDRTWRTPSICRLYGNDVARGRKRERDHIIGPNGFGA